jgi:hypothetical protein
MQKVAFCTLLRRCFQALEQWPILAGVQESSMDFEIVGEVVDAETIAINLSIRENADLRARFGGRRWRKRKGKATVRMPSGGLRRVELHWYEAHGVGKRKIKIKHFLE